MKAGVLADRLEVWGFEGDVVIFADGSCGFALELVPLDVSCWTDEELNGLALKLQQFLNGLPETIDIQFVQEIKGGNDLLLQKYENTLEQTKNPMAKELAGERIETLKELDAEGQLPVNGLKVFVCKKFNKGLLDRPKLFSKPKDFEDVAEGRLAKEIKSAHRIREDISHSLENLGIQLNTIVAEELLREMYEQWNPMRSIELNDYNPENIREGLLYTDVVQSKKGFSLYNMEYRVLSLKNLPDYTFSAIASRLRELPFDSKAFLSIHVPNQQEEINSLQTQRRVAFSLASSNREGVSDIDSNAKLNDLEAILEEMISQGERIFHTSLNIILRAEDEDLLESYVAQALGVLRELAGAEGLVESYAAFEIFSQLSIPNARCRERSRRMKTSNLADLLPVYGSWPGHKEPSILLRTRMGSLLNFNPFQAGPNANQLISGGSGSGKSFLTNLLILQSLKANPKVYFVDIGGSYQKLCENLQGQYIPLGVDQNITINPFDLKLGENYPSSHQIKFLVGLVELMTKEEGQERLSKLVRAELEICIRELYDNCETPRLSELKKLLHASGEVEVKRLAKVLTPWCGETPFGQFVDQKTNVSLHSNIVAFDLKGLESFPELQTVCLYLITNLIWMEIQRDRYLEKYLIFDECWSLLKDPAACDFIESVFRTCRKYYTSAVALSQAVDDFAKSSIADAILPNCSIKWVLIQQQSNSESLKNILQLNDTEIAIIKSLNQKKGEYSEAFLMSNKERALAVIEATPIEMWLATTHPKDLALVEEMEARFPELSKFEILKKLAKEYPRGASI